MAAVGRIFTIVSTYLVVCSANCTTSMYPINSTCVADMSQGSYPACGKIDLSFVRRICELRDTIDTRSLRTVATLVGEVPLGCGLQTCSNPAVCGPITPNMYHCVNKQDRPGNVKLKCALTMRAVWQTLPTWVAGGEDAGSISGISVDECETLCCQRHCHAVNYRVDGSICMMKAFGDELILEEEHSSVYNVSLTNEFQESCLTKLEFVPTATGRVAVNCPQIGAFSNTALYQCAQHCCATEGCNAFNHLIVDGGGCYLKQCTDNLMLMSHPKEIKILAFPDVI